MIWRLLQLDSVLLLVAPILIIFLIALAIDAGVTKSRERKAAEAAAWAAQAYGAGWDPQGALSVQKPRRGSKVVRSCVILGFVLLGSVVYWPLLAFLGAVVDPISNVSADTYAVAIFLAALVFVVPFSLLAFLCAFIAHLAVKGAERDQGRSG